MNALEYFKVMKRMCEKVDSCETCPLQYGEDYETGLDNCDRLEFDFPEIAISKVEDWLKENPIKTYRGLLLEKLPNYDLNEDSICIDDLMGTNLFDYCNDDCKTCWWQEIKE